MPLEHTTYTLQFRFIIHSVVYLAGSFTEQNVTYLNGDDVNVGRVLVTQRQIYMGWNPTWVVLVGISLEKVHPLFKLLQTF